MEVLHRPARRGSVPPTSPASGSALAAGAELVLEIDCDFSHDPDDVPAADRRLRGRRRPRARLALGRRRRHRQLGRGPDADLARRQLLRAHDPRRRRPRPDRRLQVLPPRRARDDRPRRASPPRATGSRSRRRTGRCAPGSASSRSRSRSPTARVGESKMGGAIVVEAMLQVPVRCAGAPSAARL